MIVWTCSSFLYILVIFKTSPCRNSQISVAYSGWRKGSSPKQICGGFIKIQLSEISPPLQQYNFPLFPSQVTKPLEPHPLPTPTPLDPVLYTHLCSIPRCALILAYLAVPVRFLSSRYGMCCLLLLSRYFLAKPKSIRKSCRKWYNFIYILYIKY